MKAEPAPNSPKPLERVVTEFPLPSDNEVGNQIATKESWEDLLNPELKEQLKEIRREHDKYVRFINDLDEIKQVK